jgi:hypothetical protein
MTPPTGVEAAEALISDGWLHARPIPTAGIRNELDRARRASSCLLAVIHGVRDCDRSRTAKPIALEAALRAARRTRRPRFGKLARSY